MFKPQDTQIFKYYNGKKFIAVDPLTISLKFQGISDSINWQEIGEILGHEEASPDFIGVYSKIGSDVFIDFLGGLRKVFQLVDLDCDEAGNVTGLSNLGVLQVYAEFVRWCDEVKKNIPSTQTLPQPMGADGSETLTTSVSSDSTSTVAEQTTEKLSQQCWV